MIQDKKQKKLSFLYGMIQSLEWVTSARSLSQVDKNRIHLRIDKLRSYLVDVELASNDQLVDFKEIE